MCDVAASAGFGLGRHIRICVPCSRGEGFDGVRSRGWRIDHTNHSALAMLALCAVVPQRPRCIGYGDLETVLGDTVRSELIARPETIFERLARSVEGSLGYRVVLRPEIEGDSVAFSCCEGIWVEGQLPVGTTHSNGMIFRKGKTKKGGTGDDGREMHYELMELRFEIGD